MHRTILEGPRGVNLRCDIAEGRHERARGLLRRREIGSDEALLLPNATSVHTFGMRFPILVAGLDESLRVLDVRRVLPGRLVWPMRGARHVLECHHELDLRPGDALKFDKRDDRLRQEIATGPVVPVTLHPSGPCSRTSVIQCAHSPPQ